MRANSDLGLMMPEVRLFHSRKKFKKYYKKQYGEKPELFDTEGQMTYRDGEALVLMTYVGREESELGLLVHEAYHAAMAHMTLLGEDEAQGSGRIGPSHHLASENNGSQPLGLVGGQTAGTPREPPTRRGATAQPLRAVALCYTKTDPPTRAG